MNNRALIACWLGMTLWSTAAWSQTVVGTHGTRLTVNGVPIFMPGISYFGGLGASEEAIRADLNELQDLGYRWIRVVANWAPYEDNVSALEADGTRRDPYFERLEWLLEECDERGLIVDVTLSRDPELTGPSRLASFEAHRTAVVTLLEELRPYRNWYLDMANEHNVRDRRAVSFGELRRLREAAREVDDQRLITASHAGDLSERDVQNYLELVELDIICPHRPGNRQSAEETATRTREYLTLMRRLGRSVPILYQQPFRRGETPSWSPTEDDFRIDAAGARQGGAAGWCFHSGPEITADDGLPRRSYDLTEVRLLLQLDDVEGRAVQVVAEAVR